MLLIQFARAPIPGQVKTRLLPTLSANAAAELHANLVYKTWRTLLQSSGHSAELWVDDHPQHALFQRCLSLGGGGPRIQQGDHLGQRMAHALKDGLQRHSAVVLVGSDCPGLDRHYIDQACAALASKPVVLGPAVDGGYVLIGLNRFDQNLFAGIDWGTEKVYQQTAVALEQLGWQWRSLSPRRDLDRPEDLDLIADHGLSAAGMQAGLRLPD